jgi:hypothetical protein
MTLAFIRSKLRPEGWTEEFPAFAENLRDDSGNVIRSKSIAHGALQSIMTLAFIRSKPRPEGWTEEFPGLAENLRDDSGTLKVRCTAIMRDRPA